MAGDGDELLFGCVVVSVFCLMALPDPYFFSGARCKFKPALMWGGTSSIGLGKADVRPLCCPFVATGWAQDLSP